MDLNEMCGLIKNPNTSAGLIWRALCAAGVDVTVDAGEVIGHIRPASGCRNKERVLAYCIGGAVGGINSRLTYKGIADYRVLKIPGTTQVILTTSRPLASPKVDALLEKVRAMNPNLADELRDAIAEMLAKSADRD